MKKVSVTKLEYRFPAYVLCNQLGITYGDIKENNYPCIDHFKDESERSEYYHLGRINYFVKVGITDPITINEKYSSLWDGTHRFLAAIVRGDQTIPVKYI